jgi:NhaP-type Na+/H+ or K+/H+ antiporter
VRFIHWYLTIGGLLVVMAIAGSLLKRLPLTASIFYMAVGIGLGPPGAGLLQIDILRDAHLLERLTEVAVIVSLFTAGLKLRLPLSDRRWRPPVLLASVGMVVTVAGIAAVGHLALGLSPGAAVLLGAVLAPTDPVLASDVQVEHAGDHEEVRFTLTGEAGLNDGTAFPFVMLGLGLLGVHQMGALGARWLAIDGLWAICAGLVVGTACGSLVSRLVLYLRRKHREAVGLDDFLALGLIALSYGLALAIHSYGFLAVFAAGLALRRIEREDSGQPAPGEVGEAADGRTGPATHDERSPAAMAQAVLAFNQQLERVGEVAIVLVIGALLAAVSWSSLPLWFFAVLLLAIRPAATFLSLPGTKTTIGQRLLVAWFGVRGIGSVYYLAFALTHGLDGGEARVVADLTLAVVAVSIVAHGVSVTPLMKRYAARRGIDATGAALHGSV